ncbi:MAG: hypothetical protein ACLQU4_10610 [Limisphaerales bacterium]
MRFFELLPVAVVCGVLALPAGAADLKLEARLIRGANDGSETVKYKPADPELSAKLRRMFKWSNYYEITNATAGIALNKNCDLKLSDACTIRVKNLGGSRVEVNCIGHGKQLCQGAYALTPPQWLVLGGNDTVDTAWFVGLRAIDTKPADSKKAISKN